MDDWVIVSKFNRDLFLLKELLKVFPIVNLFVLFETIIKLVHLDLIRVILRENLSKDPPIRQVSLWVIDFVGKVK